MRSSDKDRAWNRYKTLRGFIKDNQCTRTEMKRGSEYDINKCMKEMEVTNRATKEFKRIGRVLGEPTNTDDLRRSL